MIGAIVRQLVGLFVDDGLLAVGILVAVGAIGFLTSLGALPTWLAGRLLASRSRRRWPQAWWGACGERGGSGAAYSRVPTPAHK